MKHNYMRPVKAIVTTSWGPGRFLLIPDAVILWRVQLYSWAEITKENQETFWLQEKGTGQCTRIIKWNVDSWVNPCNVFFVVGCTPTWTVSELVRVTRRQSTDIPFSSGGVDGLVRETISECGRWIIIRDHQLTESLWSVVCVDERCLRAAQCSSNMQQPLASTRRSWIVDQVHFREPATCESDAKLCSCPARNVSVDDSFSASSLTKYCALSTLCAYFTRVESTRVFAAKLATTQLPALRQRIKVGLGWKERLGGERPSFNRILCRIDRQMALFPEEDGPSVAGGKSAETEWSGNYANGRSCQMIQSETIFFSLLLLFWLATPLAGRLATSKWQSSLIQRLDSPGNTRRPTIPN